MAELSPDLRARAEAWLAEDPDPATRAELQALLDAGDADELADRFDERLAFGTAGLRGRLGAGPNRMNRALVRRVTAGLADRLVHGEDTAGGVVVIGRDARHGSEAFAEDATRVLAGAGVDVLVFEDPVPTPLVAFAVRHLGAAAGIVVTARHNPPADNGYKVYLAGGRQIVPPVDAEISDAIDAVGPLADVVVADADDPRIRPVPAEVEIAYREQVLGLVDPAGPRDLRIAYTALHGVAGDLATSILASAGFAAVHPVPEQHQPDPDFPTVAFPTPEEPGAMDAVIALARQVDADLILANDPDGDRIAVAIPDGDGGWRMLTGDEIGVVLAEDVLARGAMADGAAPWVATTVVSSSLLADVAAHHGAGYVETLTGFKWLSQQAERIADDGGRVVLSYEQALGVSIGDVVRDKDGISAALAVADLAARLRGAGRGLDGLLDDLARRHGAHVTLGRSVLLDDTGEGDLVAEALQRLRDTPPRDLGGSEVTEVWDHDAGVVTHVDGAIDQIDLPAQDLMRFVAADGTRVMVRPSGTEPKLKFYGEAVGAADQDPDVARERAAERVDAVLTAFMDHALAR